MGSQIDGITRTSKLNVLFDVFFFHFQFNYINSLKKDQKHPPEMPEACNFIKKGSLAEALSCEFCEISKNTVCYQTPLVAASEGWVICK